jgi:hypothetical protein
MEHTMNNKLPRLGTYKMPWFVNLATYSTVEVAGKKKLSFQEITLVLQNMLNKIVIN